jgi:hypothetical protein
MSAHRREFLKSAAAAWMAAFAGVRRLRAADADIEINPSRAPDQPAYLARDQHDSTAGGRRRLASARVKVRHQGVCRMSERH